MPFLPLLKLFALAGIAYAVYGYTEGAVEAILAANAGLCLQPPMLPESLTIVLPTLGPQPSPPKQTVNLWD